VFKRATDYDQYLAALEAHGRGCRFFDRKKGEFRRELLPGAEKVRSETTITRSSSGNRALLCVPCRNSSEDVRNGHLGSLGVGQ
jgi:hypothetical protein